MKDFFLAFVVEPLHFLFLGRLDDARAEALLAVFCCLVACLFVFTAVFYGPVESYTQYVANIQAAPWMYRPGALARATAKLATARENLNFACMVFLPFVAVFALAVARDLVIVLDRVLTRMVRKFYPEF